MAIYGLETGAFEQGGDGYLIARLIINPATGLPFDPITSVPLVNDSGFKESTHFARDAAQISGIWSFPTRFSSSGNAFVVGCAKSGPGYQDGSWVSIRFSTAGLITLGTGLYFSSDAFPGYIYTLDPAKWTRLTNLQFTGQSDPTTTWFVAKWGANAFSVQQADAIVAGRYNMQIGLLSHYIFNRGFPSEVDAWNSIGGSVQYRMVSADLTQDIDVTPIGKGVSNFVTGPVGNGSYPYQGILDSTGNDQAGVSANLTLDSRVIFGRNIPFFTKTVYSDVPDPGIATSAVLGSNFPSCVYGALWTSSATLP